MQKWTAQDAKALFSEFLDTCVAKGLQMITEQGNETVGKLVVVSKKWSNLCIYWIQIPPHR